MGNPAIVRSGLEVVECLQGSQDGVLRLRHSVLDLLQLREVPVEEVERAGRVPGEFAVEVHLRKLCVRGSHDHMPRLGCAARGHDDLVDAGLQRGGL